MCSKTGYGVWRHCPKNLKLKSERFGTFCHAEDYVLSSSKPTTRDSASALIDRIRLSLLVKPNFLLISLDKSPHD